VCGAIKPCTGDIVNPAPIAPAPPCRTARARLSVGLAVTARFVRGPFPVADKHFRGGWLCRDRGLGIWLPPDL